MIESCSAGRFNKDERVTSIFKLRGKHSERIFKLARSPIRGFRFPITIIIGERYDCLFFYEYFPLGTRNSIVGQQYDFFGGLELAKGIKFFLNFKVRKQQILINPRIGMAKKPVILDTRGTHPYRNRDDPLNRIIRGRDGVGNSAPGLLWVTRASSRPIYLFKNSIF